MLSLLLWMNRFIVSYLLIIYHFIRTSKKGYFTNYPITITLRLLFSKKGIQINRLCVTVFYKCSTRSVSAFGV